MSATTQPAPNSNADSGATKRNYTCHVISNTHWDREWRYPFQGYRMDLVDMMDRLLDIMEQRPDYRAFYLDSQTIILEDYLEIRPENEGRIRALAEAGRLEIGPWYTLPDEWECPGEALVRNLVMGHRTAKRYGPVVKVGYTPFSNGQISQLPQLYQGFGIDSCFFYRGIGKHIAKSEFLWEGADGTQVFAFRFGDYARYNYYYLVYRPGLLGRTIKDRDYTWSDAEIPFRAAMSQVQDRQYGWMEQDIAVRPELLKPSLDDAMKFTAADATTSQLLYMMGHDHSFAAEAELELIDALQNYSPAETGKVIHSSLTDYMKAFRAEQQNLQVVHGEMRHTLKEGLWTTLMALILSCRLYLKQRNARLCNKLISVTEPLAAFAWMTGSQYPTRFLEIAWKKMLANHAHDAIGGCSVDQVHDEMLARWTEVETICDDIVRRSMRDLAGRIDGSWIREGDTQLTVFNTLATPRSGLVDVVVDAPHASDDQIALEFYSADGKVVPAQILSYEKYSPTIESGLELSMPFQVRRFTVRLQLDAIPAMGYRTLGVKVLTQIPVVEPQVTAGSNWIENAHLRVEALSNGTFKLTEKATGRVYENLAFLEDSAELGDPWNRKVPEGDVALTSQGATAKIVATNVGPLTASLEASYEFVVPAEKGDSNGRSAEKVAIPVRTTVTLDADSKLLKLRLDIDNQARDHRLRVMFPTQLSNATVARAEGQFDILERSIRLHDAEGWKEKPYATNPMWNFVGVSDGQNGLAVLNDGLTEYEVVDDQTRTVAITLLRAFGKFIYERPTPGSQCLGKHTYLFGILPHTGTLEDANVFAEKEKLVTQACALQSGRTRGNSKPEGSYLRIDGAPAMQFAAIKLGEDEKSLIVRLWNATNSSATGAIESATPLHTATQLTMEEIVVEPLTVRGNRANFSARKKEIVTLGLEIQRPV